MLLRTFETSEVGRSHCVVLVITLISVPEELDHFTNLVGTLLRAWLPRVRAKLIWARYCWEYYYL